jgi:hypothetical protein
MNKKLPTVLSAGLVLVTGTSAAVINTQTLSLRSLDLANSESALTVEDPATQVEPTVAPQVANAVIPEVVVVEPAIEPVPTVTITATPAPASTPTPTVTITSTPKPVKSVASTDATSGGSEYYEDDDDDDDYNIFGYEDEDHFDDDDDDDDDDHDDDDDDDDDD